MRRNRIIAVPAVLSVALVAGCGSSGSNTGTSSTTSSTTASSSSTSAVAGGSATSTASGSSSAFSCPTENTRAFAKTRLVADIGLTVGTFHRYIYKPYQAGTFKKGADGRTLAIVKGVATAALDLKLMKNARDNVLANPTLCKSIGGPINDAVNALDGLGSKITSGDLGGIAGVEGILGSVMSKGNANGLGIKETTDESVISQG